MVDDEAEELWGKRRYYQLLINYIYIVSLLKLLLLLCVDHIKTFYKNIQQPVPQYGSS